MHYLKLQLKLTTQRITCKRGQIGIRISVLAISSISRIGYFLRLCYANQKT
jgi:hypothetical protein